MMLKLALRGLAAHRTRLALTAVAVVLGAAFVSGTMIFSATIDRAVDRVFADAGEGTDVVVRAQRVVDAEAGDWDETGERLIPPSLVETVRRVPGVERADGATRGYAAVLGRDGRPAGETPRSGITWIGDAELSGMRLTAGRAPQAGEIAVDETTAKKAGYRVGDRVPVAIAGPRRTFTLAGTFEYGAVNVTTTAFEPAEGRRLLAARPGADGYTQIVAHAAEGVSQERARAAVAAALPSGFEAVTGERAIKERAGTVKDILKILRTFLLAFAVIAVFVGSFIIFNTFSMLVAQRTKEMALLRAVGASRRQVTLSLLGEAAGVGLAGSTAGLALGGALAVGLRLLVSASGERLPATGLVLPASAVIGAYGVGTAVTLLAAYLPARRAARTPPVAALRDAAADGRPLRRRTVAGCVVTAAGAVPAVAAQESIAVAGGGAVVAVAGIVMLGPALGGLAARALGRPLARLSGPPGRLGRLGRLRGRLAGGWGGPAGRLGVLNAGRNPRRTAATASALMIGIALVSLVTVVVQSLVASVNRQLDATLGVDYRIAAEGPGAFSPRVRDAVARVPGVRDAVASRSVRLKLAGQVRTGLAGDPAKVAMTDRLAMESGTAAAGRDGILLGHDLAAAHGWRVGSVLPARYRDGTAASLRVAGIYAQPPSAAGATPALVVGGGPPDPRIDRVGVLLSPGADRARTERDLKAALAPWPELELKDRDAIKKDYTDGISIVLRLVLVLLALSVVIAALGIVNTLALSVIERTREIGLLRAVGLERGRLRRMIRYEAVLISVFGASTGLGVGVFCGWVVQRALADEGLPVLVIPAGRLASYVVAAGLIGVLAAVWPARRAARMNVLDAIAAE